MSECVFCRLATGLAEPELTVYEDDLVFVQISLHQKPRNRGHLLVIPKLHVTNLLDAPAFLDAPLLAALRRSSKAVESAFSADGIQVRQNNGAAAGQDVFHLHFHVIPRFNDDAFENQDYEVLSKEERGVLAAKLRDCLDTMAP